MNSTEIICTIGPTCEKPAEIEELIKGGMNIARFNFSHETYETFTDHLKKIKRASKKLKIPVAILADLKGPRIRVGKLPETGRKLVVGDEEIFVTNICPNIKETEIVINDPHLHKDVKVDDLILLDNGDMEVKVTKINKYRISTKVIQGGVLFSNKGINLPRTKITTSTITEKDIKDIKFAKKIGVDFLALSFVGSANDIITLKKLLGRSKIKVIAKIERQEALENFPEILKAADGIMVARGDLGIETRLENVPIIQKEIIKQCRLYNKPVIVATQLLASMVLTPIPTRAEVSDIANAVLDGATAVMLSNETAMGQYPIQSLNWMRRIIERTENYLYQGLRHIL